MGLLSKVAERYRGGNKKLSNAPTKNLADLQYSFSSVIKCIQILIGHLEAVEYKVYSCLFYIWGPGDFRRFGGRNCCNQPEEAFVMCEWSSNHQLIGEVGVSLGHYIFKKKSPETYGFLVPSQYLQKIQVVGSSWVCQDASSSPTALLANCRPLALRKHSSTGWFHMYQSCANSIRRFPQMLPQ